MEQMKERGENKGNEMKGNVEDMKGKAKER